MFELAIANLRANLSRLVATVVAIVAGVAFLSAGLMFTDAISSSLSGSVAQQYSRVSAAVQADSGRRGPPAKVPASVVAKVASTEGVAAAAGKLSADIGVYRPGHAKPESSTGRGWIDDDTLRPTQLQSGHAPTAAGQVAVDRQTASSDHFALGQRIQLATTTGKATFTVVGITKFGDNDAQDDSGTFSFASSQAFAVLNSGAAEFSRVLVAARSGVSDTTIVHNLKSAFPKTSGLEVRDRTDFLDDESGEAAQIASFLRPVLIGFALLALFVCGFVIANTFAVVVAQRTRELALLLAIGATPRQVKRSLRLEALGIGLISSVLGLVVGALIALGAAAILAAFDVHLPGAGVKVTLSSVVIGLAVGTVVTVVSVSGASRRAAKIAPVVAMRSGLIDTNVGVGGVVNRLVGLGIGLALLVWGSAGGPGWILGVGAFAFVISVLRCGRLLTRASARFARPVMQRLGIEGRLAGDNIGRNAKRAATTANALVIGVLLITLVTTAGGTLKQSLLSRLDSLSSADLTISGQQSGLSDSVLSRIGKVKGIEQLAVVRSAPATIAGKQAELSSGDVSKLVAVTGITTASGSLSNLGSDGMAVSEGPGGRAVGGVPLPKVGDQRSVTLIDGSTTVLTVKAILTFKLDSFALGDLVTPDTFTRIAGDRPASQAFAKVSGRTVTSVKDDVEKITDQYSEIAVLEGNFIGQILGQVFDFLIAGVNGLLGMSVFIAIIGIVNTMSLSVLERRREIGLLRAVGMMPGEARRMVRYESLIIGVLGTVTGMGSGLLLSFMLISRLDNISGFSFEWAKLGIILVVGVLVGLVAAVIPARRVARLDVLDALRD